jgi:hypothetical protein
VSRLRVIGGGKLGHRDSPAQTPPEHGPVEFNDEETAAIRAAWPRGYLDNGEAISTDLGFVIEGDRAASFRRGFLADTLAKFAQRRFRQGDAEAGISSCLKSIRLWSDDFEAWLVLCEIYASVHDFQRADHYLKEAEAAAHRRGIKTDSHLWVSKVADLNASLAAAASAQFETA